MWGFFVERVRVFLGISVASRLLQDRPCVWPGHGNPLACQTLAIQPSSAHRLNIQTHQCTLGLGEVPNDFLNWRRQPSHQGWNGDDLIALCQLRLLEQVDDFNTVLAPQLVLTNFL